MPFAWQRWEELGQLRRHIEDEILSQVPKDY